MVWAKKKAIVTLRLPGTWVVRHPITKLIEEERRKILRGWWTKKSE
jgi:hypothetical protein